MWLRAKSFSFEAISFSLIGLVLQGLPSYTLPSESFAELVKFFFFLALFRSLVGALVSDPLINFFHNGRKVWEVLVLGGGLSMLVILLVSASNLVPYTEFSFAVFGVLVLDLAFFFTRRLLILNRSIFEMIGLNAFITLVYSVLYFAEYPGSAGDVVTVLLVSYTIVSLSGVVFCHLTGNGSIFAIQIRTVDRSFLCEYCSLIKFTGVFNIVTFFLSNSYIMYFSLLSSSELLAYVKSILLFYAPSYIFVSGLGNKLISDRGVTLLDVFKPVFLLQTFGLAIIPVVVFSILGPEQYRDQLLLNYHELTFAILISNWITFVASSLIFIFKREGNYSKLLSNLFWGSLCAVVVCVSLYIAQGENEFIPFIFSGVVYMLFILLAFLSKSQDKNNA